MFWVVFDFPRDLRDTIAELYEVSINQSQANEDGRRENSDDVLASDDTRAVSSCYIAWWKGCTGRRNNGGLEVG